MRLTHTFASEAVFFNFLAACRNSHDDMENDRCGRNRESRKGERVARTTVQRGKDQREKKKLSFTLSD